ncbi:hypothetical protein BGZ82_003611 [Podila clonocystis]|nr:hypothetical protein BGZ82_003611 [Podila clonocystis]
MESHDHLTKLVAESHTPDRPEVRAKASIALVSFASEQTPTDDASTSLWQDAWIGILRGLGDEWPLVREAFQEQLTKTLDQHKFSLISRDEFLDQVIADAKDKKHSPLHKLQITAGVLTLQQILREQGNSAAHVSLPKEWSSAQVDDIVQLFFAGWSYIQGLESARLGKLLAEQISSTRIIGALGSMTSQGEIVSSEEFIEFCANILGEMSRAPQDETSSTTDWALALWISEHLRIPTVFVEQPFIQESDENRASATNFVRDAYPLLQCIHYLVQIQPVNNTYTLHRLIIASASFTNPGDLWNTYDPILGTKIVHQAHNTLQAIIQHTPWSDTGAGQVKSTTHQIMIPGSLSDHVIKILQREMRPCFIHARAQSIELRAQATVVAHQDQVRQQLEQESKGESQKEGASDAVGVIGQSLVMRSAGPRKRFQIAEVGDDANEVDELHEALHRDSNPALGALSKRWDTHCLESVAVTEWCALQPIQDVSRVQEVFMTLVGPILAMMDSNQDRFRARGLNLVCRFLIQHLLQQRPGARAASDSRIWIRIFEKTGLDQVLIRGIVPLIAPLNVMITEKLDPMEALLDSKEFVQDTVSAALRAFFTLIVVNTEPEDRPPSMEDATTPLRSRHLYQARKDEALGLYPLTIEELFIKGVLGSFRRTSPSKEYRALILRWMQILIQPVVSLGFLVRELENEYFRFGTKVSENEKEEEAEEESKKDREKDVRGVYGLGPLATKYLPTLVTYLADVLDLPFPSSPIQERIESLEMAWRASEALCGVIQVSRARIPRYRGRIMAAIANCWANSRIFEASTAMSTPQGNSKESENLAQMQKYLDTSLIRAMQLCTEASRTSLPTRSKLVVDDREGEKHGADETEWSGLQLDLKVLKDLDPSVFGPLFQ